MRAWTLETPKPAAESPLVCVERPVPEPGPLEVAVRVHVCGVCRTDLHVVEGDLEVRRPGVTPGHQVVGTIESVGASVTSSKVGDRVGVAWLHRTCGECRPCRRGRENLCERADFTGWTVDGGFAEVVLANEQYTYPIPSGFSDLDAAPLLCAGIIGYRCLRMTGLEDWSGARLGIYGFGAAGHVAIQIARARGAEVYVCTRDRERHQALAGELGAEWVGGATDRPPVPLDASLIFAPAGELVPPALEALGAGGVLVLGGIWMSPIPSFPYERLYRERVIRSVTNNTRRDGEELLAEAARIPVETSVQPFAFERANEALDALKNDAIRGAAVLVVNDEKTDRV
ncbi:MAG: zinc-dependent alcohol dehydrogenase family protein [Planctomycetota bacterium]